MAEEWTMDDASFAEFCGFTPADLAAHPNLISGMKPERRRTIERMAAVVADLNMGVVPADVIVCRDRCGSHG